jgi:hypothetical protein
LDDCSQAGGEQSNFTSKSLVHDCVEGAPLVLSQGLRSCYL